MMINHSQIATIHPPIRGAKATIDPATISAAPAIMMAVCRNWQNASGQWSQVHVPVRQLVCKLIDSGNDGDDRERDPQHPIGLPSGIGDDLGAGGCRHY